MTSAVPPKSRVPSVDALRGLIMIIMALDHVRDFLHSSAMSFQPDDLTRTNVALFFTRWVTHICAPVFMFTAGLGAYFWLSRGRTKSQLSGFLWKRGLWLVVLELTVLRFAFNFSFSGPVLLTVLWALGWSMVALGFLVHLPVRILATLSIAVIVLHNLADSITASQFGSAAWVWNIVHQQGVFPVAGVTVVVAYPLVPWIAVMAAGFCFGYVRQWSVRIGIGLTIAFFVMRAINVYGDPSRWTGGVLSFLRCTKYPPSLDFLLMTLGPALLLLAWLKPYRPLVVFGRVPLFYFLVHFYLIHTIAVLLGRRYDLWMVYVVWIAVVVIMYPLCLWWSRLKDRRTDWWLSYL